MSRMSWQRGTAGLIAGGFVVLALVGARAGGAAVNGDSAGVAPQFGVQCPTSSTPAPSTRTRWHGHALTKAQAARGAAACARALSQGGPQAALRSVPNRSTLHFASAGQRTTAASAPAPLSSTATSPEGDSLTITADPIAIPTPNPLFFDYTNGENNMDCGWTHTLSPGDEYGACVVVTFTDAQTGSVSQSPPDNSATDTEYDGCGNVIGGSSTFDWEKLGSSPPVLDSGGHIGGYTQTVPVDFSCEGTWRMDYTYTQKFSDGDTLTVRVSGTFTSAISSALPAYGMGNGDASVHNPSCGGGDPVNCASGNFSETYTDVSVPGRGPNLDLTRTYNSVSSSLPGIFGYGWSSPYDSHLAVNNDGSVTITEQDGSQVTASANGDGTYSLPTWANSTLAQNENGTWTFVYRHDLTYTFSANGQLTLITDRNGYATQLSYNGSGQLSTVTDPAGRTLTFTFGSNGFVSTVADPIGQLTKYGYSTAGDLTSVTDPMTRKTSFGYGRHLLSTVTDPNHGVTSNYYDGGNRVIEQVDPKGLVTTFAYSGDNFSSAGGTTTITDPHGNTTVQNYKNGEMTSITKGSRTWTYAYDPNTLGRTTVFDPNGHQTTSSYDAAGNLLSTTDALFHKTSYTYNAFDEPLTMTDPRGIVTTYTYDSNGNTLSKTVTGVFGSPIEPTTYTYGGQPGDISEITDPAGRVSDYAYDAQGDITSSTVHPEPGVDNTTSFVYDGLGRRVCKASPTATAGGVQCPAAGQPRVAGTTTWSYDPDSEMVATTDPLGNTTNYSYDPDGNQTQVTDPRGNVTKTTYDADSRKISVVAGFGTSSAATTSYSYDISPGSGSCSSAVSGATYCTTTTDPGSQTTVDYFNAGDQRIEETQPSSGTSVSTYDPAGNLSTLTTNGGKATYAYDAANELTSITYSNAVSGYGTAASVSYHYDADGRRTSMTDGGGTATYSLDSLERLASVVKGSNTTAYGYDLDNRITSITYPGSHTVTQVYDGAEQESSLTDWLGHTSNFSYDADGNLTTLAYPNGTTASSAYGADDNLISTQDAANTSPSSPFAGFTYTDNADSQVQTETDTGGPGPTSQSYAYDQLDRLLSSTTGSYGYNKSGDPTQLLQKAQSFTASHQVTGSGTPITRVGTSSVGDSGTGLSLTVPLPAGVLANDQILLAVTTPGNGSVKTTPSGYTLVGTYSSGNTASNVKLALYRRTAVAGDSTVTVTFSATFTKAATVVVYRGVSTSKPIDVSSNAKITSGQSLTLPSVTTTKNDELVAALGAESASAGTWTAPAGMTKEVSQAGGSTTAGAIADQALVAKGATGTRTATFSLTGALAGVLVALAPNAQTTYTYDSLGDRKTITTADGTTTTLSYNQLGEMTAYGSAATYTYDGDGLRATKKVGSTTTTDVWESGPSPIPRLLADGTTDYIYGPDGLPLEQVNGTTALYYLHDRLGSTRVLTNAAGGVAATYTYDSFGNLAGSTGTVTNPFKFAGSYTDSESGLLYLQHRYYDPATAQFTSVDSLVDSTNQAYNYALDDPINATDPMGLACWQVWRESCRAEDVAGFESWVSDNAPTLIDAAVTAACLALEPELCLAYEAFETAYSTLELIQAEVAACDPASQIAEDAAQNIALKAVFASPDVGEIWAKSAGHAGLAKAFGRFGKFLGGFSLGRDLVKVVP
jgi:RHS repeat-associated protein